MPAVLSAYSFPPQEVRCRSERTKTASAAGVERFGRNVEVNRYAREVTMRTIQRGLQQVAAPADGSGQKLFMRLEKIREQKYVEPA